MCQIKHPTPTEKPGSTVHHFADYQLYSHHGLDREGVTFGSSASSHPLSVIRLESQLLSVIIFNLKSTQIRKIHLVRTNGLIAHGGGFSGHLVSDYCLSTHKAIKGLDSVSDLQSSAHGGLWARNRKA